APAPTGLSPNLWLLLARLWKLPATVLSHVGRERRQRASDRAHRCRAARAPRGRGRDAACDPHIPRPARLPRLPPHPARRAEVREHRLADAELLPGPRRLRAAGAAAPDP